MPWSGGLLRLARLAGVGADHLEVAIERRQPRRLVLQALQRLPVRNDIYCQRMTGKGTRAFARAWPDGDGGSLFVQRPVAQIPWGHNIILVATETDGKTLGLILCTDRNEQVVEYALRGLETPIAVPSYRTGDTELTEDLPIELQEQLPSVPELEAGLRRIASQRIVD